MNKDKDLGFKRTDNNRVYDLDKLKVKRQDYNRMVSFHSGGGNNYVGQWEPKSFKVTSDLM